MCLRGSRGADGWMCNLQLGVSPRGFRLKAKASFLKDVTAGCSWSLPILGRELTVYY